jgi:hypothetical protein
MSAEPLDWYKREQRRFLNATAGWSLENKGAYSVLIDLIMDQPRGLIDNDQWIAGQLGTSVRKWRIIKSFLVSQGKISVNDGIISNKKADKVKIIQRSFQDKQAENRRNPNKNKADEPTMVASREDKKITTNVVNTDTIVSVSDKPKSTRGSRIDPDWQPTEKDIQHALTKGLSHDETRQQAERFRDFWISKAGAGGVKLDWAATWRTWVGNYCDRRPSQGRGQRPTSNGSEPVSRADIAIRRIQEAQGVRDGW